MVGVVALGVIVSWQMSGSSDPVPKRWSQVHEAKPTDLYNALVNPCPSTNQEASLSQSSSGPIPPPPDNWNEPHVAVYSVAATPRPLPTLRDLGDRGQAQAIDFLEKDAAQKNKSWTKSRKALSNLGAARPGENDPFQFDRVLVATVTKGAGWDPGDRMMWTRVFVQPINFESHSKTISLG